MKRKKYTKQLQQILPMDGMQFIPFEMFFLFDWVENNVFLTKYAWKKISYRNLKFDAEA